MRFPVRWALAGCRTGDGDRRGAWWSRRWWPSSGCGLWNAVNAVCLLYGAVILLVVVAGIVYLLTGHPAATDPAAFHTWSPWHPGGINFANWTFFGVVVLALLGVEVPLNLGVEIRDPKAITRYLLWGSAVVVLAYLVTTWAVMVTVPATGNQSVQITAVADVVTK